MAQEKVLSLHEHAVQAEAHLEGLATGLAGVGAEPQVVQAVSKMADVTRQIVKQLGKQEEPAGDAPAPAPEPAKGRPTMDEGVAAMHQEVSAGKPQAAY